MTDEEKAKRLRELAEIEEHAHDTLRKLDYPKSVSDYMWWGATWWSASRWIWRKWARRALEQVAKERAELK